MQRRTLPILMAFVVGAAVIYGGGRFYVARKVEGQIAAWVEAQRTHGWRIDYESIAVEGFPFSIRARIDKPSAAAPPPAEQRFAAGTLYARFSPWQPRRVTLEAPAQARIDWGGIAPGRATFSHATVTAMLGPRGRLQDVALTLNEAEIATPAEAAPARMNRVTAHARAGDRTAASVPPHRRLAFAVKGEMLGLTLPERANPPLGRSLGRLALDLHLLGEPPPAPGAAAMAAWRDGGGTMEIKRFGIGWGPLKAEGEGTLALDGKMQPEGALTARIAGFDKTVETLVDAGIVPARHGVLLGYALNALAKRPPDGGPPVIEAPVTMQRGRLFIGPVALMPLPVIDWK